MYRGAKVTTEDHVGPVEATTALAARIMNGGMCVHCGRTTVFGATDVEDTPELCSYVLAGDRYHRSCESDSIQKAQDDDERS